jgi:membrane fusion protein (multidrug efflux system)
MNTTDNAESANGRTKKLTLRWMAAAAVLAGLIVGAYYFVYSLSHESTDDAYVTGTIVPVAPEIRGRVVNVYITDNQYVRAGAPLLDIFPQDYADTAGERVQAVSTLVAEKVELQASLKQRQKALAQAQANLAAAQAEQALAEKDFDRYKRLVKEDAATRSQYDNVESRLAVAHARKEAASSAVGEALEAIEAARGKLATQDFRIRQAQAAHRLAELNLARTTLVAPVSGRIAKKSVDPGKYVQPGQALLAIVQQDTWVVANYKETQVGKMAVGQPVEIKVDAYPGITFRGHVDSLQPGTGAVFSLLPPENATGNFVKVVQRLPVKILVDSPFDPRHPLWPGLSVAPTVDVSRKTGSKLSGR